MKVGDRSIRELMKEKGNVGERETDRQTGRERGVN